MDFGNYSNLSANEAEVAVNRASVRLGRRFAPTIAAKLDAHAPTESGRKVDEENRILDLAREVLSQRNPDPIAMNFLTQAVELYTNEHGFSKTIYDELFRLHKARTHGPEPTKKIAKVGERPKKTDLSQYLAGGEAKETMKKPSTKNRYDMPPRMLKV